MEPRNLYALLVGVQIGTNILGNNFAFSNKLKFSILYNLAIPFLSIYQWQIHACMYKERCIYNTIVCSNEKLEKVLYVQQQEIE